MTANGLLQILIFFVAIFLLTKPLGGYMTRVFAGERTFLSPILRPLEKLFYRVAGVDPDEEQRWTTYAIAMLLFNLAGFVLLYAMERLQASLPLNPQGMTNVAPDLAFNTAVSFVTNTNWQNYGGETTMSYLIQMAGLTVHNFVSAATGIALALVFIRGFSRNSAKTLGNFWADLTRCVLYVLLPIAIVAGCSSSGRASRKISAPTPMSQRSKARSRPLRKAHRLANRDQDARHQWRRLYERQCRAPV